MIKSFEELDDKTWSYLHSIDGNDPDRKSPFNVGDTVVHRDPSDWEQEQYGLMIVLGSIMMDLSDKPWEESKDHDYRFFYTLLVGDEKINRFEERLKLYDDT